MAYTPNPADPTQPQDNVDASTAAAEFRALKGLVATLVTASGKEGAVRQTVLTGPVDSSTPPQLNMLQAGTGLNVNLRTAVTAALLSFAQGFNVATGAVDVYTSLQADTDAIFAVPANNTSYIYADYVSTGSVTWGQTLVLPQIGFYFDKTKQAILNFEGINGAVTTTDDFGNTWTPAGNAKIDTSQFKFGTSSTFLDGTGDWWSSSNIISLGGNSWTIEGFFRWNSLPGVGTEQDIFNFGQGSVFGVCLGLNNTGGIVKLFANLSSTGSSLDIATNTAGTKTTWNANQWYHIAIVYDALNGKIFWYVDGVQDQTITTTARICAGTSCRIGSRLDGTDNFNGWVDAFRILPACLYPNGITFTPPAQAPSVADQKILWMNFNDAKMYEVTSASASAGTNPGMTAKTRIANWEVDSGAATISAVRNYQMRGKYTSVDNSYVVSTAVSIQHNIGSIPKTAKIKFVNQTTDSTFGFKPGDTLDQTGAFDGTNYRILAWCDRSNTSGLLLLGPSPVAILGVTGAAGGGATPNNWKVRVELDRGWPI